MSEDLKHSPRRITYEADEAGQIFEVRHLAPGTAAQGRYVIMIAQVSLNIAPRHREKVAKRIAAAIQAAGGIGR